MRGTETKQRTLEALLAKAGGSGRLKKLNMDFEFAPEIVSLGQRGLPAHLEIALVEVR